MIHMKPLQEGISVGSGMDSDLCVSLVMGNQISAVMPVAASTKLMYHREPYNAPQASRNRFHESAVSCTSQNADVGEHGAILAIIAITAMLLRALPPQASQTMLSRSSAQEIHADESVAKSRVWPAAKVTVGAEQIAAGEGTHPSQCRPA